MYPPSQSLFADSVSGSLPGPRPGQTSTSNSTITGGPINLALNDLSGGIHGGLAAPSGDHFIYKLVTRISMGSYIGFYRHSVNLAPILSS